METQLTKFAFQSIPFIDQSASCKKISSSTSSYYHVLAKQSFSALYLLKKVSLIPQFPKIVPMCPLGKRGF